MSRFLPATAFFAAAFSSALFTAPATAQDTISEPVSLTFDETAIHAPDQAARVLRDLRRQARNVCTYIEPILNTERVDTACVSDVMTQAVTQIESPALIEAYNLSSGEERVTPARQARLSNAVQQTAQ